MMVLMEPNSEVPLRKMTFQVPRTDDANEIPEKETFESFISKHSMKWRNRASSSVISLPAESWSETFIWNLVESLHWKGTGSLVTGGSTGA